MLENCHILIVIRDTVDEFLDMMKSGFFFTEFVFDHLHVLADLDYMTTKVVLQQFKTNKCVADFTSYEAFGAS
jgi:hypothetical protein